MRRMLPHLMIISLLFATAMLYFSCSGGKQYSVEAEKLSYEDSLQVTSDRISRKIAEVCAERGVLGDTIQNIQDDQISDLEALQARIQEKLGGMDDVSDDQWKVVKPELDGIFADYTRLVQDIQTTLPDSLAEKQ